MTLFKVWAPDAQTVELRFGVKYYPILGYSQNHGQVGNRNLPGS